MSLAASQSEAGGSVLPLRRSSALYMLHDTPKGRGVFASESIAAGTVIETCPVLVLGVQENKEHIAKTSLYHYTYNWPLQSAEEGKGPSQTQAVVFGLGSLFNHSTRRQNVGWTRDLCRQAVVYRALRDVAAGEELCISYGDRLTFVDADTGSSDSEQEDGESVLLNMEL